MIKHGLNGRLNHRLVSAYTGIGKGTEQQAGRWLRVLTSCKLNSRLPLPYTGTIKNTILHQGTIKVNPALSRQKQEQF